MKSLKHSTGTEHNKPLEKQAGANSHIQMAKIKKEKEKRGIKTRKIKILMFTKL